MYNQPIGNNMFFREGKLVHSDATQMKVALCTYSFTDCILLVTATPDIREGKTVSVHADQTTPQHRKAANGSVPGSNSHTPRGSIGKIHYLV